MNWIAGATQRARNASTARNQAIPKRRKENTEAAIPASGSRAGTQSGLQPPPRRKERGRGTRNCLWLLPLRSPPRCSRSSWRRCNTIIHAATDTALRAHLPSLRSLLRLPFLRKEEQWLSLYDCV
ncbi:hypothetical protein MRX96_054454 [Rhipicephalus microplus]